MDIKYIREPDKLKILRGSQEARFAPSNVLENAIKLDCDWRDSSFKLQQLRTSFNRLQKTLGKLRKTDPDQFESKCKESKILKEEINQLDDRTKYLSQERENAVGQLGNIVHPSVPVSNDENDNVVVRKWGNAIHDPSRLHHSDAMLALDMYNFVAGVKVMGHRGYFLKNDGVILNQALINYGLNFLRQRGYTALQTPFMMTQECMSKTVQLSDYDDLLYNVGNDKYLIATSEQPISCYHQDEWLKKDELPLKYAGYSTCFRKEAGSHGKDVKGLFRVHQFEKVEQFVVCSPEDSWNILEEMVRTSEEFLQSLGIPYRVVSIVSGELNNAAAKKYDIEGWFPSTGEYRELVSCSNCTDYQSRKLLIRNGFKNDATTEYVHMLNGTLCATERLMCCIVENYYQCQDNDSGEKEISMVYPDILKKYIQF